MPGCGVPGSAFLCERSGPSQPSHELGQVGLRTEEGRELEARVLKTGIPSFQGKTGSLVEWAVSNDVISCLEHLWIAAAMKRVVWDVHPRIVFSCVRVAREDLVRTTE